MKSLLYGLLLLPLLSSANPVVNLYNWANYMPHQVLHQFEQETGIHVNYTEFDSNETLYAKLKSNPNLGYDLIVPSSYYIPRLAREGMLHPIDLIQIPNKKYLQPLLMDRAFDRKNRYSLPYLWGVTGIVVNRRFFNPQDFAHWQDLWNPRYKNQLLLLDDMREVFSMALITLGYSVNDTNPQHIQKAYQKLVKLLPNIKLFNSDAEQNIYVDADAAIGMGWNGDVYQVQRENTNVSFVYPKDPFTMWIDCLAIPVNAPHLDNAYKLINFINRPEIAAKIAEYNGYSSPNTAAIHLLPKKMQQNRTFNPPTEVLQRANLEQDIGPAVTIYEKYWQQLKLGSE